MIAILIAMLLVGYRAARGKLSLDSYVTARKQYGFVVVSLAYAATAVSGSTFLGMPGLVYKYGMSMWTISILYPLGMGIGMLISVRFMYELGQRMSAKTIPEYLGVAFNSPKLRLLSAFACLLLIFYMSGQLIASMTILAELMQIPSHIGLILTTMFLALYMFAGGTRADIETDAVQMMLMLAVALIVIFAFVNQADSIVSGFASRGEPNSAFMNLSNPSNPLINSFWSAAAILFAHIPITLMPHLSTKIWSISDKRDLTKFIVLTTGLILVVSQVVLAGILARYYLVDGGTTFSGPNSALPFAVSKIIPSIASGLAAAAIMSAILSSADGIAMSLGTTIALDILPFISRRIGHQDDTRTLRSLRFLVVLSLVASGLLAWAYRNENITTFVWAGSGGLVAGLSGPLLWLKVSKSRPASFACASLVAGVGLFVALQFDLLSMIAVVPWSGYVDFARNPFAVASASSLLSVAVMMLSKLSKSPQSTQIG